MTAIGSLVFCNDCGNLLGGSSGEENAILVCEVCGAQWKGNSSCPSFQSKTTKALWQDTSDKSVSTRSKPSAFPSALRLKRSAIQTLTEADAQTAAKIRQTCPKCGRKEMTFTTAQLRSADEGTTVFYVCKCGHRCVPLLLEALWTRH